MSLNFVSLFKYSTCHSSQRVFDVLLFNKIFNKSHFYFHAVFRGFWPNNKLISPPSGKNPESYPEMNSTKKCKGYKRTIEIPQRPLIFKANCCSKVHNVHLKLHCQFRDNVRTAKRPLVNIKLTFIICFGYNRSAFYLYRTTGTGLINNPL